MFLYRKLNLRAVANNASYIIGTLFELLRGTYVQMFLSLFKP
mgnify:FL=1